MPKSQITKRLYATYMSTLGILCCLLIVAQFVIQVALQQALVTQNAYSVLNTQQLRTQRLIRNSILLLDLHADKPSLFLSLYSDEQAWEVAQNGIDEGNAGLAIQPGDFPSAVHNRLNNARLDYHTMRTALHGLIESETKDGTNQAEMRYIAPIFYSGGVYSAALTQAASDLFIESKVSVANIRVIEFGLFLLCLLTLIAEYTFVFRPSFQQMTAYLMQLHARMSHEEERVSHEENHAATPPAYSRFSEEEVPEEESETGTIDDVQKGLFDEKKHNH